MNQIARKAVALLASLTIAATSAMAVSARGISDLFGGSSKLPSIGFQTSAPSGNYWNYYSSQLNSKEKQAYNKICNGLSKEETKISVPVLEPASRTKVFKAVFAEHPEYYYADRAAHWNGTDDEMYFIPTYNSFKGTESQVKAAADQFLANAPKNGSDYEKELYVHDKLVDQTTYQLNEPGIYNSLINHVGNCEGYSFAMEYLLSQLGVKCRVIEGKAYHANGSSETHMWNIVRLDGKDYVLDATWDDAVGQQHSGYFVSHRYFNRTKDQMASDHVPNNASEWSTCTNDDANFFKKNGLYFKTYEDAKKSLADIVKKDLDKNDYNVALQFGSKAEADKALNALGPNFGILDYVKTANQTAANKASDSSVSWDTSTSQNVVIIFLQK